MDDQIIKLLNTPIATTLLGFILGLVAQPIVALIKICIDKWKFRGFERMIFNSYVEPLHKALDNYSINLDHSKYYELSSIFDSLIGRLEDLKEKELIYLTTDNQFKMVRLIEFIKSYFREVSSSLNGYVFMPLGTSREDYIKTKEKQNQEKNIQIIKDTYKKYKKPYIKLEIDSFPLKEELVFLDYPEIED